jgi:hypothetical protein
MVDDAYGQNQVKSTLLSLNRSQTHVTTAEAPPGSEALPGRTNIFRAYVESCVVDCRKVIQNISRSTPNIENFVPRSRFHVLSQISSPGRPPAHHPAEKPVTGREIQNRGKLADDLHIKSITSNEVSHINPFATKPKPDAFPSIADAAHKVPLHGQ